MRINNKKRVGYFGVVYMVIILMFITGVLFTYFEMPKIFGVRPFYILIISIVSLLIILILGKQIFEYDSDGDAVNFKTREYFLADFIPSMQTSSEFPKRKLLSYHIKTGIIKQELVIKLSSKRSGDGVSKLAYNITYLNKKEISDLIRSLKKIIEDNNTTEHVEAQNLISGARQPT